MTDRDLLRHMLEITGNLARDVRQLNRKMDLLLAKSATEDELQQLTLQLAKSEQELAAAVAANNPTTTPLKES